MANGLLCTVAGCEYVTTTLVPEDAERQEKLQWVQVQMQELQIHTQGAHPQGGVPAARTPGVKAKMDAPKLQLGVDQQAWDQFMTRWEIYKTTMGIDSSAPSWLFACLDKDLGDEVIKANPGTKPMNMTEEALTASIKKLAVKVESKLLHRIRMGQLKQDPGVNVNNYLAALRGQARQCQYVVTCSSCNAQTDYSEEVIRDQLIRGLHSQDIVADIIGDEKTDRTLLETVDFIARKEQADLERNQVGVETASASAVQQTTPVTRRKTCKFCQGESHGADTVQVRREKCPAWDTKCTKCQVRGHFVKACSKCTDCGKWGHRSKNSRWCAANEDEQILDDDMGAAIMISGMTMSNARRRGKRNSAPKRKSRQIKSAWQPRQNPTASSSKSGNSPAGGNYERPFESRPKAGTAKPNLLAGYRRFNAELSTRLSKLGIQSPGDTFATGAGAISQGILTTQPQGTNFGISWPEQVMNYEVGHEAHGNSLLSLTSSASSRPIMSTGGGVLSTTSCSQFTPNPVLTDTTTSTVTITTSSASVSAPKWEQHYKLRVPAPQGGRFNFSGPQLDFSYPADSLPAPTTSSPGTSYQDLATISHPTPNQERQEEVSSIPIPEQEEPIATAVEQRENCVSTTKLAPKGRLSLRHQEGLPCPTTGCGYTTTTQVPDDTALGMKVWLLQDHIDAVHSGGDGDTGSFSTSTVDAVGLTNVERTEHGDSTTTADHIELCNSSTSRSKKSQKRTKSRRTDVHSSGELATMIS